MKIAALYTCFNRREKTLLSIKSLYESQACYNNQASDPIELEIFLTDDGCTDGTAKAIRREFGDKVINIQKGDGYLFWAGGMRLAWSVAHNRNNEWDYYLLLNDDTIILDTCFSEILSSEEYCRVIYNKEGIISGITCSSSNPKVITYGGDIFLNRFTGKTKRLGASERPQMVDMTNANIMLVPVSIVNEVGIFYNGFIHSAADADYSMMARHKGFPVLITAKACGICDDDHFDEINNSQRICKMSFKERIAYYKHPLRSGNDYLTLVKRNMPLRFPLTWMFNKVRLIFPRLYFSINRAKL